MDKLVHPSGRTIDPVDDPHSADYEARTVSR
jgi:hypothetical protein